MFAINITPKVLVLRSMMPSIGSSLLRWQERATEAWRLRNLDEHLLRDIGISRRQADEESRALLLRR